MISIERTHEFSGRYHVLGGALSPIDGIDPEDLKIAELLDRFRDGDGRARWWSPRTRPPPGEATALHIAASCGRSRPGSRSPGSPAGCRWAPTSSTPTS